MESPAAASSEDFWRSSPALADSNGTKGRQQQPLHNRLRHAQKARAKWHGTRNNRSSASHLQKQGSITARIECRTEAAQGLGPEKKIRS